MSNIFIKDANSTTLEIFTFEDSTSVHHNASVPILQDGTVIFTSANPGVVQLTNFSGGTPASGSSLAVSVGGAVSTQGVPIVGSDGTDARRILTDSAGRLIISALSDNKVSVGNIVQVCVFQDATPFGVSAASKGFPNSDGLGLDTAAHLRVINAPYVFNRISSTWDRMTGTSAGLLIAPPAANWPVSVAGTVNVSANGGRFDVSVSPTQGNIPVSIGGALPALRARYDLTKPTVADGTVSVVSMDVRGNLNTVLYGNNTTTPITTQFSPTDALPNAIAGLTIIGYGAVFNRASGTWDRMTGTSVGLAVLPVSIAPQTLLVHVCNAAPGAAGGSSITTSVGGATSVQAVPMAVRDTGGDVRQPLVNPTGNLLVHVCNGLTVDVSVPPISGGTQTVSVGGLVSVQAVQIAGRDTGGNARSPLLHTDGTVLVHVCNSLTAGGGGGPTVSVGGATSVQAVPVAGSDINSIVRLLKTAIDGTLKSSGYITIPSYTFTRPTDVVAYAAGDLLANSTVAGTVVPLSWPVARLTGTTNTLSIRRARVRKSGLSITNCAMRLHIFTTAAGVSVSTGDNRAITSVWSPSSKYAGAIDITIDRPGADGSFGEGSPASGNEINMQLISGATSISGLIEMRGGYTPLSGETFTVALEVFQD